MLGLLDGVRACLFDLDEVLTQTAKVHAAAWKEMFDAFLRERATESAGKFVPFDPVADYDEYVDGLPRSDGVRAFLAARSIDLPEGTSSDPPTAETVVGLGSRKNEIVLRMIHDKGVEAYEGSVRYVHAGSELIASSSQVRRRPTDRERSPLSACARPTRTPNSVVRIVLTGCDPVRGVPGRPHGLTTVQT